MTHPAPAQRIAALEACIVASVNLFALDFHKIQKYVRSQKGFETTSYVLICETVSRLRRQGRIEHVFVDGRSVPVYRLPEDPTKGFSRFPTTAEGIAERERKILQTMNWPRFFHIPTKEELRPHAKSRTGYDVREDMNRF